MCTLKLTFVFLVLYGVISGHQFYDAKQNVIIDKSSEWFNKLLPKFNFFIQNY